MFKNQPKGLYILALANTGERFGYFTVIAVFLLYLQSKFGFSPAVSGQIYAGFMATVYFMPIIGGMVADRWSFPKCVTAGMCVMGLGYLTVALASGFGESAALAILISGLLLVAIGTGLFKSNLQVMIGDLYNDPRYAPQRDSGFSIFYMAINLGAMFAPAMATYVTNLSLRAGGFVYNNRLPDLCNRYLSDPSDSGLASAISEAAYSAGMSVADGVGAFSAQYMDALSTGYGYSFAVAFGSMVISYLIYRFGRSTWSHIAYTDRKASGATAAALPELTPAQTRSRMTALFLVFAVVIFFWMVFHQNGATLTEFAKSCISPDAGGWTRIGFNVWALLVITVGVYAGVSLVQSKKVAVRVISGILLLGVIGALVWIYRTTPDPITTIQPQDYQQFNGFFIVALTPFSLAIFAWLARSGKEPSAPRKIGYGMVTAALAYGVMTLASVSLTGTSGAVSPNWLISTYLLLTIAELLLSPMGISFVSKVAPPRYKGMMMGFWFGATAVGNYLVSIPMLLWGHIPVWLVWTILAGVCVISALFIFAMMRKLEAATE